MDKSKPTILIIGGSLGALSINNAIKNNLEKLVNFGVNLVWQTGSSFYDLAKEKVNQNFFNCVKTYDFINDMHLHIQFQILLCQEQEQYLYLNYV